ncbi:TetR/AcrR family transcriptional regulator [Patulibacter sp.]|uniref:TetR/AcrR family transcriptional regulator n=1 Tax=Patulibacter sp. TaxID=1912859 RepID=UPI00271A2D3D|nr:TetR/AcrR family transcriptional regulator [Patulibacter sp.]MDO9410227.1 TetR/AcrR family transcriptional regulator [Patulibacter sp.]
MATSTETPRRYHHGDLRTALLRRAEDVLAEDGADALSLRGIARDVGVSHAAPRRHFPDKQALLDALAEEGFRRLGRALDDGAAGGDADPRPFVDRLVALAEAYVGFAVRHAALLELMFTNKYRPGASPALVDAGRRAFEAPFALMAAGQSAGDVVAGDVERVTTAGWAGVHGLAAMVNAGLVDVEALPELLPEVVERLVLGLRPRA